MRFKKDVSEFRREFLTDEFNKYIKTVSVTKEEKKELIKWVSEGNSVYENSNHTYDDYCKPNSFIDDLRLWKELYEEHKKETLA